MPRTSDVTQCAPKSQTRRGLPPRALSDPSDPKFAIRNPQLEGFSVQWEPRLVEEVVLRAVEIRGVQGFRGERNRLYEIRDPEERDAAFRDFHAGWFERLNLSDPVWQALHEQPLIPRMTRRCIVTHARASRDEGAELFVSPGGEGTGEAEGRSVGIRLDPQKLMNAGGLLAFLRHELFHIADMLDPPFAYEPRLPRAELGPAHERLLQDRYRVLWDTYIDGRLVRRGWAPHSVRDHRLQDFTRSFPMLGERIEEAFARFFDGPRCTHPALISFATNPELAASSAPSPRFSDSPPLQPGPHAGQRCPLCGFPTHAYVADPDQLPHVVLERIREDFPKWNPSHGLCQQCSDLYRSRVPSY
jgi:hypothetical protein